MNIPCGWCGTMIPEKNAVVVSKKRNEKICLPCWCKAKETN